ncbi:hypothetical protein M5K25_011721 [Dendrobium thyrsiflorum]|uniref:Uncharacterized protein n=1 Tax=Dendrobium thyrsiflorum TaxID=117978 RepID=A0ABD0V4T6_DENTH
MFDYIVLVAMNNMLDQQRTINCCTNDTCVLIQRVARGNFQHVNHSFHAPYIDMWLCSHSSIPSEELSSYRILQGDKEQKQ